MSVDRLVADADEAALLEPLGVSHNAIEQLEVANEDVLIIGCGPIGCLATAVARSMGAKRSVACGDVTKLDFCSVSLVCLFCWWFAVNSFG